MKTFPELTIDCLSTKQILIFRASACENLCAFNPRALLQPKLLFQERDLELEMGDDYILDLQSKGSSVVV